MADFAALKRKYAILRQLREAASNRAASASQPTQVPTKNKPAPPPRVQKRAPVRAGAVAPGKGLNQALAAAGIGESGDRPPETDTAGAAKEVKRPGVARKRQLVRGACVSLGAHSSCGCSNRKIRRAHGRCGSCQWSSLKTCVLDSHH